MITAYRNPFKGIVNRILIDKDCSINIPHAKDDDLPMVALWDTGATCTCISQTVAKQLSLMRVNVRKLTVADNKSFDADVYCIKLKMGHFIIETLEVCGIPMDGKEENMIIGMDVITRGDLCITNYNGQTVLTFREPSLERIDYVADIELNKKCFNGHIINTRHHIPDKCLCGSGKLYHNCHGQSVYAKYYSKNTNGEQ